MMTSYRAGNSSSNRMNSDEVVEYRTKQGSAIIITDRLNLIQMLNKFRKGSQPPADVGKDEDYNEFFGVSDDL